MKDFLIFLGVGVVATAAYYEGRKRGYAAGHEVGKLACKCDPLPSDKEAEEKQNWKIQGIKSNRKIYV